MKRAKLLLVLAACAGPVLAQTAQSGEYRLALPDHKGQLKWSIPGFQIIETSAKPNRREIGLRGRDGSGYRTFLGFLFLAPENAPLTGGSCRDAAITQEKKANPQLKVLNISEIPRPPGLPLASVTYTTSNRDGSVGYRMRGFVATGDICGDLELYSDRLISDADVDLRKAFLSLQFDPTYMPQFSDWAFYAQVLFQHQSYRAAAPVFEKALTMVPSDGAPFKSPTLARRVMRDQAGMSYGMSGELAKARSIFEKGTVEDPDYPLNYYNLACADAGENKLADARVHLQQAFDRKGNVNPGETMPVPAEDNSFLPYKDHTDFWAFIERLRQAGR